ncbi:MAG: NAD-dependent epimerase/dehydratase family protein, partial [Flavobacteriales bacterium]
MSVRCVLILPWFPRSSGGFSNYLRSMVFVTGATGLVGRYLVDELLQNGEHVRALCRP